MILLEIPESIRAIGGFILALVLGYLVLFIPTALFSKVFNVNIQTRGNREPNITPQSLDIIPIIYKNLLEKFSNASQVILKKIFYKSESHFKVIVEDNNDSFIKMKTLKELYDLEIITRDEFIKLKDDVFRGS
jgi:hypothetical protein